LVFVIDAAGFMAQLENKNRILQDLATSDELTGLSNRHRLDTILASEMERSSRYREPLSIIMFDIDNFKHINDTWGHQAGDKVLQQFAEITKKLIREPDNLFRWGGEEFILLAPHTDLHGAIALAEKLRAALEAGMFAGVGSVTASFGVAEWLRPGNRDSPPENREDWFKRVDQALYRAKNTGRNRVVGFGAEDAMPLARVNIDWRQDWESGNRLIDDEHRTLLDLSNNLLDVSMSGSTKLEILGAVDALIGHVAAHFADEEKILEEAAYPELAMHADLHKALVQAALDLRSNVETGTVDAGTLFDFLVDQVVVGHMINADMKFFEFTKRLPDAAGIR
jgi:diguanylate cyclase (GGDEF)-like protein/hemerythrin-like metal-binding protein